MRRKDREVTDFKKMMQILESCDCCRIGLVDQGEAYIVPLNFGYEEVNGQITLYFHGAAQGRKAELLKKTETLAFEMDTKHTLVEGETACDFSYLYQSIMGKGKVKIFAESADKIEALKKIMAHYSDKQDWTFRPEFVDMTMVFQVQVTEWSCKEH
ncbi:pyridoxamine 5'-phosphate oxidase family protein [Anaerotignum lactatifermentans]|uniref:Pyridoxamine 5'-phosphate oxidase family protein n=1 Tax=Anaerotignum lactatifermentans TaxID=160404 RepID=A0ABS2GCK5_9FIRM|nr:pyridoxamine 5'-phosphate oxidase family protein [Anaerotignum lactatifermentans]MBM6830272.1 pyridoxamine 5'-phosphate oxidase family protein [Anaerotignum lactatifermentans]MBM6878352.1 pyridoxamine 5'-phosphate oxidase family protein [Anaerotignum lactatifermentans]MBM6951507.1 pyridoxamine 5'-phosphate oxidase family protein [Anaerotignum lactatifermentans]